ncbi:MAG: FmdB family zinc ribbon protein [Desulfovibrionales bacterium]
MPIYEYRCTECQQIFEEWQKDFKERDVSCPVCNGNSKRLISNTSFVLKGSGWYVTDYCNKRSANSQPGSNGSGESAETSKESKSTDSASSSSTSSDSSSSGGTTE